MRKFLMGWFSACVLLVSGASAEGLSLADIARMQTVGEIAISADGEHIAYTVSVPRDLDSQSDGPAWSELHVLGPDGQSSVFVGGEVNVRGLSWRPDRGMISFLARRDGDESAQLYGIALSGGEARRLAEMPTGVSGYSFSPDGNRVALIAMQEKDSEAEALADRGFNQIVFEEDQQEYELYIQSLNGAGGEPRHIDVEGSVQAVRWSPAGDRLALSVTPRQLVDDTLMFKRIRIIDTEGEELGRVDNPGKLGDFQWSPDGRQLAMIATTIVNDPSEGRILVTGAEGGDWTHLMPGHQGHVRGIAWAAEDRLLFLAHEGVETRIGSISANGAGETTLFAREGMAITGMSLADSGRLAVSASTASHPSELFAIDAGNSERLTDSNPWLAEIDLARQSVFEFEAEDGLMIQGLLVWPLDYREGQRYPLILAAHGGPESHYSNGWLTSYNLPAQHAAAEGYFMYYPNYRGSTGRGVEFTLRSQGRPAREEFSDLVDGIDALIDDGLVDGDKVGITGGSYGGYASAWAATYYTERFAASVMNVGLSDKIGMLGTSDIPRELYLVHYRTWPWENWDLYREASPIYYAQQARTPLLILHGAADPRVDPTQSKTLYRYISLQDNPPPLRLVLYPGEGHGNRRAASRWDYSLRLMRWMNHYLKGEGGDPPPYQLDYGLDGEDEDS
ncbi:S9 family peptidase [Wenzhouxiangella marina]|uniref:Peptidase S9 prolyl oligopeptidase active site domain protein n=1 Tax=Wenzhouxiangella marina TaxID=1579979 RepID=A0A0K0XWL2_9GAMM|nr:S9 family peptidase [Wenzhouxiangella marina]AKS42060.1 Peptidase S9 prolyl oligopeptidase active site domain protein [Wenzhouxiangella marina]MBB6086171.1 dipeptidyl aminopeptidase/acylaminoacyl peptidase [Wenzhouxiangella marina]